MVFIFSTLIFLFSFTLKASELRLISADFDPYTYKTVDGEGSGVMYEIVQELAKRVGQSPKIEFLPWARAQLEAQNKSDIGIIPLARVPEREEKYQWLIHVLSDPYVFFASKKTKFDISSVEALRYRRIGTFNGSLAELLLRKKGFQNFRGVPSDAQNVEMLRLGRIDVWVAPLSFRYRYKEKGGMSGDDLRVGATLVELNEYLGASKNLDQATVKKWREAFLSMKNDGSYALIMKKYGFKPLE